LRLESLERREVFTTTLAPIVPVGTVIQLQAGAPLQIGLDGGDTEGDALTYTVTSTNGDVSLFYPSGNRSLEITLDPASIPAGIGDKMVLQLFEDRAPRTTGHIADLANSKFYDGLTFHRVIDEFVIQGGDPNPQDTTGALPHGSHNPFDDEFVPDLQHTGKGVLSMAKSSDDTNDSQFFITEVPTRSLDFNHSIFGQLVEGEAVREYISNVDTNAKDVPITPVIMKTVRAVEDKQNRVLQISALPGTTGTSKITVTVSDGNGNTAEQSFDVNIIPDPTNNQPYLLPIADIKTTKDTPTSVTLTSNDVDGGPVFYFYANSTNSDVELSLDKNTGVLTVTPKNGFVGVAEAFVAVARTTTLFETQNGQQVELPRDDQAVPILIAPGAPTSIDLATESDTGTKDLDNRTQFDNSSPAKALKFVVDGVTSGNDVEIFAGSVRIGHAIAAGTSVTVTTDGVTPIPAGAAAISARQTLLNQALVVRNRNETVNLVSNGSAPLGINIFGDWQNPLQPLDVDDVDGITPLDALLVINALNDTGVHDLPPETPTTNIYYYDVDPDGILTPLDALIVINYLNDQATQGPGSPGFSSTAQSAAAMSAPAMLAPSPVEPALAVSPSVSAAPTNSQSRSERQVPLSGLWTSSLTDVPTSSVVDLNREPVTISEPDRAKRSSQPFAPSVNAQAADLLLSDSGGNLSDDALTDRYEPITADEALSF